jgi:hypothetical protein
MTNKLKTIAPKEATTKHNVAARVPRRLYYNHGGDGDGVLHYVMMITVIFCYTIRF